MFGYVFAFEWSKGELWWLDAGAEKHFYLIDVSIIQRDQQRALQIILLNLWIGVARA